MKMVNITIKIDCIGMEVGFEYKTLHLSNCLPKVIATCGIFHVESDLEVKFKNQYWQITYLCQKESITVGEHPI